MDTRSLFTGLLVAIFVYAVVPQVRAEKFLLQTGETIEGTIIRSVGKTLSIKLPERGLRQLPISEVDQVEMTLRSGEQIVGELIAWSSRGYEIQVADRLLSVKDGDLILDVAVNAEPIEDINQNESVGGPRVSLLKPEREQKSERTSRAEPVDASISLPVLTGSSTPVEEGAGEAIVHLDLSKAAPKPVVIMYSVIERSAKNGVDYQDSTGVAIISAGKLGTEVTVPIINDDLAEPDETFELFLSVDPVALSLESRRIVTIVKDDDS